MADKPDNHTLFLQYPYYGVFRWKDRSKGLGLLSRADGESLGLGLFAHREAQQNRGRGTEIKDGAGCLYAIGHALDAYEYEKGKGRKRRQCAIHWTLIDDVGAPPVDDYHRTREEAIAFWGSNELKEALEAKWYKKVKNRVSGFRLESDPVLLQRIKEYEQALCSVDELVDWYALKAKSPQFVAAKDEDEKANRRQELELWKALASDLRSRNRAFFGEHSLKSIMELCRERHIDMRDCSDIGQLIVKSSVALDIETSGDSEEIHQFGWFDGETPTLHKDINDEAEIQEDIKCVEKRVQDGFLVGHNLIEHDVPELQKKHPTAFSEVPLWDTLLMSWVLDPWKPIHALTTSEKPHQADADAKASWDLFNKQILRLRSLCTHVAENYRVRWNEPEVLLEALRLTSHRQYQLLPEPLLEFLRALGLRKTAVLPDWRLDQCAWAVGVSYAFPSDVGDEHKRLQPDKLRQAAGKEPEKQHLTALYAVCRHAQEQGVEVLLRMIPEWLREAAGKRILTECLEQEAIAPNDKAEYRVTTFSAWRNRKKKFVENALGRKVSTPAGKNTYALECLHKVRDFDREEVRSRVKWPYRDALIPENDDYTQASSWFLPDPAQKLTDKRRYWEQWKWAEPIPGLQPCSDVILRYELPILLPRWQATDNAKPVFVSPSSENRQAYWEGLLQRLLSLPLAEDEHYVLLVSKNCELEKVNEVLCYLDHSPDPSSLIGKTSLRQLEVLRQEKRKIVASMIEEAGKWLVAARELSMQVRFVIEAVPLERWWMCLDSATRKKLVERTRGMQEEPDRIGNVPFNELGNEDDESVEDVEPFAVSGGPDQASSIVPFSPEIVQECTNRFLPDWIESCFQSAVADGQVMLLDARCEGVNIQSVVGMKRETFDLCSDVSQIREAVGCAFPEIERESHPPVDYESCREFLRKHWGHNNFRDTQDEAIRAIAPNDKDVLVRLPTGEGKSVLFQIPALLRGKSTRKLTLVVSPLRALMVDQVHALRERKFDFSVDYLNADREPWMMDEVYRGVIDNSILLLYVAPERFRSPRFRDALARRSERDGGLEYVVIDEAHCVSLWGFDFRPDYLTTMRDLQEYRNSAGPPQFLFFSATVTEAVREDITQEAGIPVNENIEDSACAIIPTKIQKPVREFIKLDTSKSDRPLFDKRTSGTSFGSRLDTIVDVINGFNVKKSAIVVFVTRRWHAEKLKELLLEKIDEGAVKCGTARPDYFHAGLTAKHRKQVYQDFKEKRTHVLIATKAFGMGMDIPHIHACIHFAPPASLEDYLQEVGRTGRDEKSRSEAGLDTVKGLLLYHPDDHQENLTKIKDNQISPPILIDLWRRIETESHVIAGGGTRNWFSSGTGPSSPDDLRMQLFWLERAGRIRVAGAWPKALKVRLNEKKLKAITASGDYGAVAHELSTLYSAEEAGDQETTEKEKRKLEPESEPPPRLGFVIEPKESQSIEPPTDYVTAIVRIDELWRRIGGARFEDVLWALYELHRKKAICIPRKIEFTPGPQASWDKGSELAIWDRVNTVRDRIFEPSSKSNWTITVASVMKHLAGVGNNSFSQMEADSGQNIEKGNDDHDKRIISAVLRLTRNAGLKVEERLGHEGVEYNCTLGTRSLKSVAKRVTKVVKIAQKIAGFLQKQENNTRDSFSVDLANLLRAARSDEDKKPRWGDIQSALRLLTNLGWFKSVASFFDPGYLVEILCDEPLLAEEEAKRSEDAEMYENLGHVNEMRRLRCHGMALYTELPSNRRDGFIERYFEAASPGELESLLIKELDALDSGPSKSHGRLAELREYIRSEAIEREKNALTDEQWDVCKRSYKEHILVNAGPGSGKTRVLIVRSAHLIHEQHIAPQEILILAFNRAVVHELRKRITGLFRNLGYGPYVWDLSIYTFHAFALKIMGQGNHTLPANGGDARVDFNDIVHDFVLKLERLSALQEKVSHFKAIFVDEFQDMNDDFYRTILAIQRASGAGLMAIGDDDQDILMWNRPHSNNDHGGPPRLHATEYFHDFQREFKIKKALSLTVNYRSDNTIVERSQSLLKHLDDCYNSLDIERLKKRVVLKSKDNEKDPVELQKWRKGWLEAVRCSVRDEESNSVAVLCRSNAEAVEKYYHLKKVEPDWPTTLLRGDDGLVSRLREVGEWIEVCRHYVAEKKDSALDEKLWEDLSQKYQEQEFLGQATALGSEIETLWRISKDENTASLSGHVDFLENLNLSDYNRMASYDNDKRSRIVVSTIHKVKGLEFDAVVICASDAKFPFSKDEGVKPEDYGVKPEDYMAEEARLFYVAMTRAKKLLYLEWERREKSWFKSQNFRGRQKPDTKILLGGLDEVHLSWPGYRSQVDSGLQEYIRTKVAVGDKLRIKRSGLFHGERHIGNLAEGAGYGSENSKIEVASVWRQPVNEKTKEDRPNIYQKIEQKMKDKGWLYTVLVQGVLR